MRERWARRLACITCSLVLAITAVFAATHNAGTSAATTAAEPAVPTPPEDTANDGDRIARGRAVYASLDCAGCHSIAGAGSPRNPLDGVGSRLHRSELQAWTLGEDSVAADLSPRALRAKRGYRALDREAIDALLTYLASLKE